MKRQLFSKNLLCTFCYEIYNKTKSGREKQERSLVILFGNFCDLRCLTRLVQNAIIKKFLLLLYMFATLTVT